MLSPRLVCCCRELIKDRLIPRAVAWYTGAAVQELDDDEDDDEDDDDEEDDDDDEDEDEEEVRLHRLYARSEVACLSELHYEHLALVTLTRAAVGLLDKRHSICNALSIEPDNPVRSCSVDGKVLQPKCR